jgi:aspartate aminotransferase
LPRIARRFEGIELSLIRQIAALATSDTIDLGLGEPNLVPDATFLEMAKGAATASWRYSPNAGHLPVRAAVARSLDPRLDPQSRICITAGTEEGLYAVMQAWVDDGDEVLVPDPGFVAYPTLIRLAGGQPVSYPLDGDGWTIEPANLERAITPRTKMIIVNSPSNPTGSVVSAEVLRAIVGLGEDRGILVVVDEVYRELQYDSVPPSTAGLSNAVITLGGMSKSHGMTGLRLGWVIAAEEVMTPIVRAHQYIATCASVFAQDLARRVLENRSWNQRWLGAARRQMASQRDVMLRSVEQHLEVPVAVPAGAFYLLTPAPACSSVDLAKRLAAEAGVLAIPGAAFGSRGEGFLRLSYATAPELIERGVEAIGAHLRREESCRTST